MTGRIEVKIEDIIPNRIYLIVKGSKKYLASHNGALFVRIQGFHVSLKRYTFNFDTVKAEGGKVYESITTEQQFLEFCFSTNYLNPSLESVSHLFPAQVKSNNLVYEMKDPFPKEGSNTDSIKEIVDYLTRVKGYTAPDKLKSDAKGIGWNMSTCWYLANPKASSKLLYAKEQLFITNLDDHEDKIKTTSPENKYDKIFEESCKSRKIAVKFSSKEESAHILKHFNPREIEIPDTSGWMCLDDGMWNPGWALLDIHGYTEISFNDWCEEYNHPYKTERFISTMKFFEQLREPERSEAIANYNEDYGSGTKVPGDLAEALNYGFAWHDTELEHMYWMVIKDKIENGTYFKEEPKDYKEAVHCTTQEEWAFVLSKFNPNKLKDRTWDEYKEDTCLNVLDLLDPTNKGCYSSKSYYINKKYNILTFKQWCEKYGYSYSEYLLNVASIKYPIGTNYHCAHSSLKYVIREKFKYYGDIDFITDGSGGSVYYSGKWAEVIDNRIMSKTDFSKARFLPPAENEWKPIVYDLRGTTFDATASTIDKLPYWTVSSINSKSLPSLYNPDALIPLSTSGLVSFKRLPKLL